MPLHYGADTGRSLPVMENEMTIAGKQAFAGWLKQLPAVPSVRPYLAASNNTPLRRPDAELALGLRRAIRGETPGTSPSRTAAKPKTWASPSPSRPPSPQIIDVRVEAAKSQKGGRKTAIGIMVGFFGGVVVIAAATFALALGQVGNWSRIHDEQEHLQKSVIPGLQRDVNRSLGEQNRRIESLQAELREVRQPPSVLRDAQDLLRAGRYADAEAAFGRFLAENPHSRLADIALRESALAAVAAGKCNFAASRLVALRRIAPNDATALRANQIVADCRRDARLRNG